MSRALITIGTGFISFAGSVALTFASRHIAAIPVMGIAAGVFGMVARNACLEENESLRKKDWVMIVGASVVGAMTGGTTVALIMAVVQSIFVSSMLGSMFGSMLGSMIGTIYGNMYSLPIVLLSSISRRPISPT